ncbi:MAG: leucyl/phenylalanyl-tRNA--protein transferase [Angustibacter sp.]
MTPSEPPPTSWSMDALQPGVSDLVAIGADLEPGTLLAGYRRGLFPMGTGPAGSPPLGWWSPDPRGVLPLAGLHVSRSLRRSSRRFETTVNQAFDDVVAACADPDRPGRWITDDIAAAYRRLHLLGWAHSVECWRAGRLVGGVYGVAIGGLFAGESMFHHESDASKVALVALADLLRADDGDQLRPRVFDVQWRTEHLARLGVVEVARSQYQRQLALALHTPLPRAFTRARS